MYSAASAPDTRRKKVSLKIDAELMEKAKAAGIDPSRVAEAALNRALAEPDREQLRKEIAQEFRAIEEYVAKHGNPAKEWREMFGGPDFDAT